MKIAIRIVLLAIAIGLFAGGVMGYFNGILVTRLRLRKFTRLTTSRRLVQKDFYQKLRVWISCRTDV